MHYFAHKYVQNDAKLASLRYYRSRITKINFLFSGCELSSPVKRSGQKEIRRLEETCEAAIMSRSQPDGGPNVSMYF